MSATLPTLHAVMPPVAASHCTAPTSFRYQGTITAAAPGAVSCQWVYSSGQQGPVQTADFAAAGQQQVTGATVTTKTAGTGWAEIKMIRPASATASLSLTVGQPALKITGDAPATAAVGTAYSGTVTASGGNGTYNWATVTGLPAGLTATASGATLTISGAPDVAPGTYQVKVTVTDSGSPAQTATVTFTLTVNAAS